MDLNEADLGRAGSLAEDLHGFRLQTACVLTRLPVLVLGVCRALRIVE